MPTLTTDELQDTLRRFNGLPEGSSLATVRAAAQSSPVPGSPGHRRDTAIAAAIAAGRITAADRERYERAFWTDREAWTRDVEAAAAAQPAKPPTAAKPAVPAASGRLARGEDGRLSYAGHEVRASAAGAPCVFTEDGWLTVSSFEASGGTPEDLTVAREALSFAPGGRLTDLYNVLGGGA